MVKRTFFSLGVGVLCWGLLWGCVRDKKPIQVNDEVITFSLPMDLVYLRTLEAAQKHKDWDLERTDKEKGQIYLRNRRYSSYADADQRRVLILLKRVSAKETTVQLDVTSQAVVGGDEILALIKRYMAPEVERKKRAELAAQSRPVG